MSKKDDLNKYYKISTLLNKVANSLFFINIGLSIISVINNGKYSNNWIFLIQILIIFSYIIIKIVDDNQYWFNAENNKFISSYGEAYGIDFSNNELEQYYNNDLNVGNLKFIAQSFESIFFTNSILKRMTVFESLKMLLIANLFLGTYKILNDNNLILVIFQTIFSAFVIEHSISFFFYKFKINNLYDKFYEKCITISDIRNSKQTELSLVKDSNNYEYLKAYYKIRLNSKLFYEMNNDLSKEWESMLDKSTFLKDVETKKRFDEEFYIVN